MPRVPRVPRVPSVVRQATAVGVACVAFDGVVQLANLCFHTPSATRGRLALLFPLFQAQNLAVGIAMACLFLAVQRWVAGRAAVWVGVAVIDSIVWVDQIGYKLFGDHIALSQADTGGSAGMLVSTLFSSMRAEVDGVAIATLVVLVAGLAVLAVVMAPRGASAAWSRRRTARATVGLAAYGLVSVVTASRNDTAHLDRHPVLGLFRADANEAVARGRAVMSLPEAWKPVALPSPGDDSARLAGWRNARTPGVRPNIVFIILESVGSDQLLPDGRLDSITTPELAGLAQRSLIYPDVYGTYPGTTRAHIPMMTGGPTVTWGSLGGVMDHYAGPTLPRWMKSAGYHTGLFAAVDLKWGALLDLYKPMAWDTIVHFGDGTGTLAASAQVHGWGVSDDEVRRASMAWIDRLPRDGRPFYLQFETVATHHPYGVWGTGPQPYRGNDPRSRYLNSLHDTDADIGRLVDNLAQRRLLDHTLIVITGDHGQAFGDVHENNFTHRNFLYEENIHNFLMLLAPAWAGGPLVSHRVGTHGDIFPTMATAAGLTGPVVAGRDLTAAHFEPRIAFFSKASSPAEWGLRDGRWKFIDHLSVSSPELYDLASDPREQRNVADAHPELVAAYRVRVTNWFMAENEEFESRLVGVTRTAASTLRSGDLTDARPTAVEVGRMGNGVFVPAATLTPADTVSIRATWPPLFDDYPVHVQLIAPDRRIRDYAGVATPDRPVVTLDLKIEGGLTEGEWDVVVWRGRQVVGKARFVVRGVGS